MKTRTSTKINSSGELTEDVRVTRSKRDLADALESLLAEKKFDDITVKEISERAMVSKLTFYNNFVDKKDLLTFMFERYSKKAYDLIKDKIEDSSIPLGQKYKDCVSLIIRFLASRPIPLKEMIKNDSSRTVYWILSKYLQETSLKVSEMYGALLNINVRQDILSYYYAGAFTSVLYNLGMKNEEFDSESVIESILILTNPPDHR